MAQELTQERVVDWSQVIREVVKSGLSEAEIARLSGLSRSNVNRLKNGYVEDTLYTPGSIIVGLWRERCGA